MMGATQFGQFEFDHETLQLQRDNETIALAPQPAMLLKLLLEQAGHVILREDLIRSIWDDRVVEFDMNLNYCVRQLRNALGDDSHQPIYIETIPKRGYRFIAETTSRTESKEKNWPYKRLAAVSAAVIGLVAGLIYLFSLFSSNDAPADNGRAIDNETLLRAEYLLEQDDSDAWVRAIPLLTRVISDDPELAEAHMAMATAKYRLLSQEDDPSAVLQSVNKVLEIDPQFAQAHFTKALIAQRFDWDFSAASLHLSATLAIDPMLVDAWHVQSVVAAVNEDIPTAVGAIEQALQLNPGRTQVQGKAGWYFGIAGDWDQALHHCLAAVELNPDELMGWECTARSALQLNLHSMAQEHFVGYMMRAGATESSISEMSAANNSELISRFYQWLLIRMLNRMPQRPFEMARIYAMLGQADDAIRWLQKARDERSESFPLAKVSPDFKSVQGLSAFDDLYAQAGIVLETEPPSSDGLD